MHSELQGRTLGELYRGKRILFIGATGFLGGVTLSLMLQHLREFARVTVLLRPSPGLPADRRFAERVLPSVPFDPLREKFGAELDALLADKLRVVKGDLSDPFLGLDGPALAAMEAEGLDVIVNCSGLVEFDAPLDHAYKVNILGARHLIALAQRLNAALLHTSTCFVSGSRTGRVPEEVEAGFFPRQADAPFLRFDPEREIADVESELVRLRDQAEGAQAEARFMEEAIANFRTINGGFPSEGQLSTAIKRLKRDWLNTEGEVAGKRRAAFWGWPNVYTYSKAIGEQLIAGSGVSFTIVRPAVIESALSYPLTGWNQNATTSAPVIKVTLDGFGSFPIAENHLIDIIPVDQVAWAIAAASAAVAERAAAPVYQIGTSDGNPLEMRRLLELTNLYRHEQQLDKPKGSGLKRWVAANRESAAMEASVLREKIKPFIKWVGKAVDGTETGLKKFRHVKLRKATIRVRKEALRLQDDLDKAMLCWDTFVPFTHDLDYSFVSENARSLARAIAPDDTPVTYEPSRIEWRDYWLDVHIPGLYTYVFGPDFGATTVKQLPTPLALVERVSGMAAHDGHRQALAFQTGDRPFALTYGRLWHLAQQVAGRLAERPEVATVAVLATPGTAWVIAALGAMAAGRQVVLAPPRAWANPDTIWATGAQALLACPDASALAWHAPERAVEWLPYAAGDAAGTPDSGTVTPGRDGKVAFMTSDNGMWRALAPLDWRELGNRLTGAAQALQLTDRARLMVACPTDEAPETAPAAFLTLAALFVQANATWASATDWPQSIEWGGATHLALSAEAWAFAPSSAKAGQFGALVVAIDLAPLDSASKPSLFTDAGTLVRQLLWAKGGEALVAVRELGKPDEKPDEDDDTPRYQDTHRDRDRAFVAVPPWQLRSESPGPLEVSARGRDNWFATDWIVRPQGPGFRLEGDASEGGLVRLENHLAKRCHLTGAIALVEERGVRLLVSPDLEAIGSFQGLRRELLHEIAKHNARSPRDQRVLAVGLALSGDRLAAPQDGPGVWWTPTTKAPDWEERPEYDLDERVDGVMGMLAARLDPETLDFYRGRLDQDTLTFERLVLWERVVIRALGQDDFRDQAFLQAFEAERAKADRPDYRAAYTIGKWLAKAERWMDTEQPERPLLPESAVKAIQGGVNAFGKAVLKHGLDVVLRGEAYVPANHTFLVVANHKSHLDGGLIHLALGAWGDRMWTLAAQDYFFKDAFRRVVAYHAARLIPVERERVSSAWLHKAREVLAHGDPVLVFPEGTRGDKDEAMRPFKSSLGTLVRTSGVCVLPLHIEGAEDVLPRGRKLPRGRRVVVRFGPPIPYAYFAAAIEGQGSLQADKTIAHLIEEAVRALPTGDFFWLDGHEARRIVPIAERQLLPGHGSAPEATP